MDWRDGPGSFAVAAVLSTSVCALAEAIVTVRESPLGHGLDISPGAPAEPRNEPWEAWAELDRLRRTATDGGAR